MKKRLLAFVAAALCTAGASAQVLTDPNLIVEPWCPPFSLSSPTGFAFIGNQDMLVIQKNNGRVRRVTNGVVQAGSVLDLPVNAQSERGLLGIALHPAWDTSTSKYVYLFYTAAATDGATAIANRVSRFTWNGTALTSEQVIIDLPVTNGPNHDGGIIRFGPPGAVNQKLYIIIGDLNRSGQTQNQPAGAAPDNTGVVIRLNDDGTVPSGADKGPFFDVAPSASSPTAMMYAYGIRNSFGMDFDHVTGHLWNTENGPSNNDEANLVLPAFNSGWRTIMGPAPAPMPSLVTFGGVGTYRDPEFTWVNIVAPTGIHFYRGHTLGTEYANDCFVGSAVGGKLYHFPMPTTAAERTAFAITSKVLQPTDDDDEILFGQGFGMTTDIGTGPDGHLYVAGYSNGTIYQIRRDTTGVDSWHLYE